MSRSIGDIMEDLQKRDDDRTDALTKEMANASGSMVSRIKDEILTSVYAESETIEGADGEYISVAAVENIVRMAGTNL